jgi:hypothetical protein
MIWTWPDLARDEAKFRRAGEPVGALAVTQIVTLPLFVEIA